MARFLKEVYSQFINLPVPETPQTGRTVIITGANVGLGLEAARHFARLHADRVILACRNKAKGDAAVKSIRASDPESPTKLDVWQLDVGDFASVKAFAARAEKELHRVDVLLCNAGVMTSTYSEMSDGWESTLAVNVIGTFLLVVLMLPKMRETARQHKTTPHVTVTSSGAGHLVSASLHIRPPRAKAPTDSSRPSSTSANRTESSKPSTQTRASWTATASPSSWKSSS